VTVLILGLSTGCDSFLVPACQFERRPDCGTGSAANADASQPSDAGSPAPIGSLRRFEWRASVSLGNNRRFVGLQGSPRQVVFLATNGSTKWWEVAKLDLNNSTESSRLIVGQTCSTADCPLIPGTFDFAQDRIYRTAAGYYYLDYKSSKKVMSLPTTMELAACDLGTLAIRPFVSAQYDAFMLARAEPLQMYVRYESQRDSNIQDNTQAASLFVVGDMDAFDHRENDLEAIAFSAGAAFSINRSSERKDSSIIASINAAIQRGSAGIGGAIQAAYIHDVNNDQLSDLLFVRGGRFRVVSYRGKDGQGGYHDFGDWAQDVAPAISGETVQYVVIDEITQDSYQDLIVETDRSVHFYRNVAM
jgi:hypothetical protein